MLNQAALIWNESVVSSSYIQKANIFFALILIQYQRYRKFFSVLFRYLTSQLTVRTKSLILPLSYNFHIHHCKGPLLVSQLFLGQCDGCVPEAGCWLVMQSSQACDAVGDTTSAHHLTTSFATLLIFSGDLQLFELRGIWQGSQRKRTSRIDLSIYLLPTYLPTYLPIIYRERFIFRNWLTQLRRLGESKI